MQKKYQRETPRNFTCRKAGYVVEYDPFSSSIETYIKEYPIRDAKNCTKWYTNLKKMALTVIISEALTFNKSKGMLAKLKD